MPAASTSVKYFHANMAGAPTLNGTAGSLISILDACLVTGFGLRTADSVTVASGIATMNYSTGIGSFEADAVILVAGATPAELNGEKRIIATTANTVTFDATGISDQTATGTITAKLAGAGWDKPFTGTNLAVYRSPNILGTRNYYRFDDTGTTNARLKAFEAMTDVNTGTNQWLTETALPGGAYIAKAGTATATARAWTVVADDRTVYMYASTASSFNSANGYIWGFGDFTPIRSGDPYSCFVSGGVSDYANLSSAQAEISFNYVNGTGLTHYMWAPKQYTGIGSATGITRRAEGFVWGGSFCSGATDHVSKFPNGPDNSLILSRMILIEGGPNYRGRMRGTLFSCQNTTGNYAWRDKVDGTGDYLGRKLLAVTCNGSPANTTTSTPNPFFFDITGPWG